MAMRMRIEGWEEFMKDLEATPRLSKQLAKVAMIKSTNYIKNRVQDKIVKEKITFQGGLQQSIRTTATSKKGSVYVGKKYGLFVELGTKPHWPPRAPIEKWARIKLGQPGLGFVIARKISQVGTKAHPYFWPTVWKSQRYVNTVFEQIPEALVRFLAGHPGVKIKGVRNR